MAEPESQLVIRVDARESGLRLDTVAAKHVAGLSRSKIQKGIEKHLILLNAKPAKKNASVHDGDAVHIDIARLSACSETPLVAQDIAVSVIYEDDYVIGVDKQAGLVVHPGSGNRDGTLVNALLYRATSLSSGSAPDRPGVIHRLDKNTSGLVLVAKTDEAHQAFAALFSSRNIEKHYTGICIGPHPPAHDTIDAPIGRSRFDRQKQTVRKKGRPAKTEYWLRAYHCGMSLMKLRPHTGRTHQIRVHCGYSGYPIICDPLYGDDNREMMKLSPMMRPFAHKVLKCFNRHALHARRLIFEHPFTKETLTIEAPYPEDFTKAMELFRKRDEGPASGLYPSPDPSS